MIKVYETISKLLKFIINVLFILQIALMIIIFLTAAYWFFNLLNSDIFSFARPLADTITDFVRIFYDRDVEVGGVYVDGSLLLFDIVALVFVFLFFILLASSHLLCTSAYISLFCHKVTLLFCLSVKCVLLASRTVFVHFNTIRIVLLVLHCVIISVFAFCACEYCFNSHFLYPPST